MNKTTAASAPRFVSRPTQTRALLCGLMLTCSLQLPAQDSGVREGVLLITKAPEKLTQVLTFDHLTAEIALKGTWSEHTGAPAYAVALSGNYAYLAANGLAIVDISNPSAPQLVGRYDLGIPVYGLALAGNQAYLAASNGMRVIDISNPANPRRLDHDDYIRAACAIAIAGNYAYLAVTNGEVLAYDIRDPSLPLYTDGYTPGPSPTRGLALADGYLYLLKEMALYIVSLHNPALPQYSTDVSLACLWFGSCARFCSVAAKGTYFYLGMTSGRLNVFSLGQRTPIGSCGTKGLIRSMAFEGTCAYLAEGATGLEVVDVSDPTAPLPLGSYHIPGQAYGVAVTNNRVYVADGDGGLTILESRVKFTQTLTFDPIPDQVISRVPISLTAIASSGLPVIYTVVNGPATVADEKLYLTWAGAITVRATQDGNDTYAAAPALERTFAAIVPSQPWLAIQFGEAGRLLSWPDWTTGFQLDSTTNLAAPVFWRPVTLEPIQESGFWKILLPSGTPSQQFFRLRQPQ
jgi:hypothetical protein